MRKERYEKLLGNTATELFDGVRYRSAFIRTNFLSRHDGPFTLKAARRCMKRSVKKYRQQCAVLIALEKQMAKPIMYIDTPKETKERCLNCGEDLTDKEWHYDYCPYCGQRLDWGDEK